MLIPKPLIFILAIILFIILDFIFCKSDYDSCVLTSTNFFLNSFFSLLLILLIYLLVYGVTLLIVNDYNPKYTYNTKYETQTCYELLPVQDKKYYVINNADNYTINYKYYDKNLDETVEKTISYKNAYIIENDYIEMPYAIQGANVNNFHGMFKGNVLFYPKEINESDYDSVTPIILLVPKNSVLVQQEESVLL